METIVINLDQVPVGTEAFIVSATLVGEDRPQIYYFEGD